MLHKLRQVMGKRDAGYQLSGVVELDEGFFSTEMDEDRKDKPLNLNWRAIINNDE
jgi:hypothetical protein